MDVMSESAAYDQQVKQIEALMGQNVELQEGVDLELQQLMDEVNMEQMAGLNVL